MNRLAVSMAAATFAVAGLTSTGYAVTNVTTFGDAGWYSDDTRADGSGSFAAGTNLIGVSSTNLTTGITGEPTAGDAVVGHDADIANQISFGAAPGGAPTLSMALGTIAEYSWYASNATSSVTTASFKLGLKTSEFGGVGLSGRTGEDAWDKVLIYEPGNGNGGTPDNAWHTEVITASSGKFWIFDRDGSGADFTSRTIEEHIANNTFGFASWWADALITSLQFGVGSNNEGADVFVDQLYLPALSSMSIDFGTAPGTSTALNLTIADGSTAGKSQLSAINFNGHFTGSEFQSSGDATTVVPEPMTAGLSLMGLAGLGGFLSRRRRIA